MQAECAAVDFNYIEGMGISAPDGVTQMDLNCFVGPEWVNDELDNLWCRNYIENKKLGVKKFALTQLAKNKAVVLVGAAPSVSKQIDVLKTLDDNFIVVACNTVYKHLVLSGVKVDYVFVVEAQSHIKNDVTIQDTNTKLIASQFVYPDVLKNWQGEKWIYYVSGGKLFDRLMQNENIETDIGGGNAISTAACWAYKYLCARDFILIGTSFCRYGDHYYFDGRSEEKICNFSNKDTKFKAADIYGCLVDVTPAQLMYKTWFERFIKEVSNATFTNSTEDGILGVVPEIMTADRDGGQYRIHYLPWINIVPFKMVVDAYKKRLKEKN